MIAARSPKVRRETVQDLMRVEGKAELVNGGIIESLAGFRPSEIAGEIYSSLRQHAKATCRGRAFTGGLGYVVPILSSGRESFAPDASYYDGPVPANAMRFIDGPPTFAVEVRSENGYGPAAEEAAAAKRADYFEAGTRVVWDVDPIQERIRSYRSDAPDAPREFSRGETADAEPAVPGWRFAVDDAFASDPTLDGS